MGPIAWRRLRLAVVVMNAGCRYWLTVHPLVRWETRRWRRRARAIPDPVLRATALRTLRREAGNLEGAAVFAALAPLRRRPLLVRAAVAFQAAFDYVDSLAERTETNPAGTRALHEALRVALGSDGGQDAYYRHQRHADDGGYLAALAGTCRAATAALPSRGAIEPHLQRAAERMIAYQALIHDDGRSGAGSLAAWARGERPRGSALRWWETAAAGASSLGVFALLAGAAREDLSREEAAALDGAYFPWIGALHVLLDSLVDQPEDVRIGHHSLVAHYASPAEAADRLGAIAARSRVAAQALRPAGGHATVLAAMTAFYLSSPAARLPHAADARERVLAACGSRAAGEER